MFTLLSSWIGAGSLLAGAENAYRNGFAALWQPAGGWLGLIVIALIAGRARSFAQFTVPDLLEIRFNATARILATIAIVISYTVITSYQFIGGGDILHLIFPELSNVVGMCIIAAFVTLFTAAAGMASIAYLDLFIGSMVTLTVIIAVPVLLARTGGWDVVRGSLPPTHFQPLVSLRSCKRYSCCCLRCSFSLATKACIRSSFPAKSERDARIAVYGWILGTVVLETLLMMFAVIASATLRTDSPREIIPIAARRALPPLLGAILLGGVFAKVISTANNFLFSPATNLIHDVYERFINKKATQRQSLIVSRLVVIALGSFALLQATQFKSILDASLYAYTVYGAAVTPVVPDRVLLEEATKEGAVESILLATVTTVVWKLLQQYAPRHTAPSRWAGRDLSGTASITNQLVGLSALLLTIL